MTARRLLRCAVPVTALLVGLLVGASSATGLPATGPPSGLPRTGPLNDSTPATGPARWTADRAQDARADLERAERAYRLGEYDRAEDLYRRALDAGDFRGAIMFNLGNCALQRGRTAEAAWWYRRAALRLPDDPGLQHNLQLAGSRLGLGAEAEPSGRPSEWLWLWLAAAVQAAGLAGQLWARSRAFWIPALLVLIAGVALAARVAQLQWSQPPRDVVALQAVEVRQAPRADAPPTGALRPGQLAQLRQRHEGWLLVRTATSGQGWVPTEAAGVVD